MKAALSEKHLELGSKKYTTFHQYNARPHVSLMSGPELLLSGWEILIHPLYSADIAPLDIHLFWSLQNSLNGKSFNSLQDCIMPLEQFFAQKDKKFWQDRIMKLPKKWQKVLEQNGEYLVQ